MEIAKNYKWFLFDQNNSGGKLVVNDKVCHRLFIEAKNESEAISIAEGLGVYFNGVDDGRDCPCCGDRWYRAEEVEFPLAFDSRKQIVFKNPVEYAQHLAVHYTLYKNMVDSRIFYQNGIVKEVKS
ncbi:MAG: DUF7296 family protein [Bdellovibrionota bacterium]